MGSTRRGSAAGADAGGSDLAGILERAKAGHREREVELPVIGEVRLRPMGRGEHADKITEDSTDEEDLLNIVAATVLEPELTAEEWAQVKEAATLGVWGALVAEVMSTNGLEPGAVRKQAARFRQG